VIDISHALRFDDAIPYGLPELSRERIPSARILANPGCYVTSCLIAGKPLVEAGLAKMIIFDARSGWSGAGRTSVFAKDPSRIADNLVPYKIVDHRHKPEIERYLGMKVSFTPHVLSAYRGILTTVHVVLNRPVKKEEVVDLYRKRYPDEPFVKILTDRLPELRDAQNTNLCVLGGFESDDNGRLVVLSAIDNLIKGAAGQAVQNMNLMLGFPETQGLITTG
jgi:N-acetyl-gamma-glutamyl-phosphate reductase